jgi:hypothetical protein
VSTQNNQANIFAARNKVNQMSPIQEACAMHDMFCFAALADATTGTMYTNLTGAFPIQSFKYMQYIFVACICHINAIIVQPMLSCTNALFISAFSKIFAILRVRNYQLTLNMMDNECSKAVKKYSRANKMDIQLVPLHNHHVNAAECAIAMSKEHFVAALATVNTLCPLQLWDEFLLQVELTLNLPCFSCRNPALSFNEEMYKAFDFNKTPLAPLGTKALVFNDTATRASWASHATNGYYIRPASNHY